VSADFGRTKQREERMQVIRPRWSRVCHANRETGQPADSNFPLQ
jgi:hypothetical protein